MTRRMWTWAGASGVLGLVVLALTIHSAVTYTPPPGTDEVLTLSQVLGFIVSGGLIVISALILTTGLRRTLDRRHRRSWIEQHRND